MPTNEQEAAMRLYADIMTEIMVRLQIFDALLAGDKGINSQITQEFCYLQFRLICELIALGCLVVHGDISETKSNKFQKEYSADKILSDLEKLHPDFYPHPVEVKIKNNNQEFFDSNNPHLTKPELNKLYGECGNFLHRGSLKNLLHNKMPIQVHFPTVISWREKLNTLLRMHRIVLFNKDDLILCQLGTIQTPDKATVSWFSA